MRKAVMALVLIAAMIGAFFIAPVSSAHDIPVAEGHPQPAIWAMTNTVKEPTKEMWFSVTAGSEKDAIAATAMVPAFVNRHNVQALIFDDGTEAIRTKPSTFDSKKASDLGADASAITNKIAIDYWSKAELIVVTDTYEHALWAVPIASFLSAPIIVSPTTATITALGIEYAIVVGDGTPGVSEKTTLATMQDAWTFQLELYGTKGVVCDYIVVTNPTDLAATEWKGASLPSGILAAYRNAVVLTADRCMDPADVKKIAQGKAKEDAIYAKIKPIQDGLRDDIHAAAAKMTTLGYTPKFMALVGGPYELPNYYIDVHQFWTVHGNTYGDHYATSVSPYACLSIPSGWNGTTYLAEDLATGRIVGHSIADTTIMIQRTIFYKEFLTGGKYANLVPSGWEDKAAVLNAHNLSQPEKLDFYPPGYVPKEGIEYYPSLEWKNAFSGAGFTTEGLWLKNWTKDKSDPTCNVNAVWDSFSKASICAEVGHGDPDSTWLEVGLDPGASWPGWKAVVDFNYVSGHFRLTVKNCSQTPPVVVYSQDIPASSLPPNVFIMISCYTGEIGDGTGQNVVFSSGMTHAGSVAFIGPTEYQTKCFWQYVPEGGGSMIGKLVGDKIATQNIAIGTAFSQAKKETWQYWKDKGAVEDRDAHMYLLYGDPKLEIYKPNKPFADSKQFDIKIAAEPVTADFDVTVTITDLETGVAVTDATVAITFNGKTYNGYTAKVTGPSSEGISAMTVKVTKTGYASADAKYSLDVTKSTATSTDMTLILIIVVVIVVVVVIAAVLSMRKKPPAKLEEPQEEEKKAGPKVMGD